MENQPIQTPHDLYDALLELLVRAREGGLSADLIQILFAAVERVMLLSKREEGSSAAGEGDNRQHFRLVANVRGTLIIDGARTPVLIQDISPQGFGVQSTLAVRANTTLLLEAPASGGGTDIFSCFVSYSKRNDNGFLLGLRIVDMLPRF
ncbi:MAG: PilZ domain-containing protein [Magnetococcales bacterium]|nr:PilZ domain-containing protein [Magnetococcales bacterium]